MLIAHICAFAASTIPRRYNVCSVVMWLCMFGLQMRGSVSFPRT